MLPHGHGGRNAVRIAPLLAAVLAGHACADIVTLADKQRIEGTVKEITADHVGLGTDSVYPLPGVLNIRFSRAPVVAQPSGVVLTDGSRFCGRVREIGPGQIVFRGVSLGEVRIPLKDVAYLYLGAAPDAPPPPPPAGTVRLRLKTGVVRDGTMFGVSPNRILLRTAESLEKFDLGDVFYVVFAAPKAGAGIVLRNGDRIHQAVTWVPGGFNVAIGDRPVFLGLDTVQEMTFDKTTEQKG